MNRFYKRQIRNQFVPMSLQELSVVPQASTERHTQFATTLAAMENTPMNAITPDKAFAMEQRRGLEQEVNQFATELGSKGVNNMGTSFSSLQKDYTKRKKAIDAVNTRYGQYAQSVEEMKKRGEKDPSFWLDNTLALYNKKVSESQINYNPQTGEFNSVPSMGYVNYLDIQEELMKAASHVAEEGRGWSVYDKKPDGDGYMAIVSETGTTKYVDKNEVMQVVMTRLQDPEVQAYLSRYQEMTGGKVGLDPNDKETYWLKTTTDKKGNEITEINPNSYIGGLIKGVVDAKSYLKQDVKRTIDYPQTLNGHINGTGIPLGGGSDVTQLDGTVNTNNNPISYLIERDEILGQDVNQRRQEMAAIEKDMTNRNLMPIIEKYKAFGEDIKVLTDQEAQAIGTWINANRSFKIATDTYDRNKASTEKFMRDIYGNNVDKSLAIQADVNNKLKTDVNLVFMEDGVKKILIESGVPANEINDKYNLFIKQVGALTTNGVLLNSEIEGSVLGVTKGEISDEIKKIAEKTFGVNINTDFFSGNSLSSPFRKMAEYIEEGIEQQLSIIPKQNRDKITSTTAVQPYALIFNEPLQKAMTVNNPAITNEVAINQGGVVTASGKTLQNDINAFARANGGENAIMTNVTFQGIQSANPMYPKGMWLMHGDISMMVGGRTEKHPYSFQIDPTGTSLQSFKHNNVLNQMVRSQIVMPASIDPNIKTALTTTYASNAGVDINMVDKYVNFNVNEAYFNLQSFNQTLGVTLRKGSELNTTEIILRNTGKGTDNTSYLIGTVETNPQDPSKALTNIMGYLGAFTIFYDNIPTLSPSQQMGLRSKLNLSEMKPVQ
jgi:hypothetical protein